MTQLENGDTRTTVGGTHLHSEFNIDPTDTVCPFIVAPPHSPFPQDQTFQNPVTHLFNRFGDWLLFKQRQKQMAKNQPFVSSSAATQTQSPISPPEVTVDDGFLAIAEELRQRASGPPVPTAEATTPVEEVRYNPRAQLVALAKRTGKKLPLEIFDCILFSGDLRDLTPGKFDAWLRAAERYCTDPLTQYEDTPLVLMAVLQAQYVHSPSYEPPPHRDVLEEYILRRFPQTALLRARSMQRIPDGLTSRKDDIPTTIITIIDDVTRQAGPGVGLLIAYEIIRIRKEYREASAEFIQYAVNQIMLDYRDSMLAMGQATSFETYSPSTSVTQSARSPLPPGVSYSEALEMGYTGKEKAELVRDQIKLLPQLIATDPDSVAELFANLRIPATQMPFYECVNFLKRMEIMGFMPRNIDDLMKSHPIIYKALVAMGIFEESVQGKVYNRFHFLEI